MADLDYIETTPTDHLERDDSPPRDAHPCPICEHDGWCTRNKTKAFCRRLHSATAVPPEWRHVKECRDGSHMYVLRGSESCRNDDGGHSASDSRERHGPCAHPSDLDWTYRQLLLRLPLTAAHRADLLRRGLPADSLCGYGSLPLDAERRHGAAMSVAMAAADRMVKTGKEWGDAVGEAEAILAASVPGFVHDGYDLSISGPAGLLIPVRDDCGWINALKVRRDAPGAVPKYLYLTSAREIISAMYEPEVTYGPSPGSPVHVPLLTEHHFRARLRAEIRHRHTRSEFVPGSSGVGFAYASDHTPLNLIGATEGELKAEVASRLDHDEFGSVPHVSFPGVGQWRVILPVLEDLRAVVRREYAIALYKDDPLRRYRKKYPAQLTVRLACDSDARRNPDVARQVAAAVKGLRHAGHAVELALWHPEYKGVDDLLAAGGKPVIAQGAEVDAVLSMIVAAAERHAAAVDAAKSSAPGRGSAATPRTHGDAIATAGDDGAAEMRPPEPCGKIIAGKKCGVGHLCAECDKVACKYWGITAEVLERSHDDALEAFEEQIKAESTKWEDSCGKAWHGIDAEKNLHYLDAADHNPWSLPRLDDCGCIVVPFATQRHTIRGDVDEMFWYQTRCKRPRCPRCGAILRRQAKEQVEVRVKASADSGCVLLAWDMNYPGRKPWDAFAAKVRRAGANGYMRVLKTEGRVFLVAAFADSDSAARLMSPDSWRPKPAPAPVTATETTTPELPGMFDPLVFLPPGPRFEHGPPRPEWVDYIPKIVDSAEATQLAFAAINERDVTQRKSIVFGGVWLKAKEPDKGRPLGRRLQRCSQMLERIGRILMEGGLKPFVVPPPGKADWLMIGLRVELPTGVTPENVLTWVELGVAPPAGDWSLPIPTDTDDLGDPVGAGVAVSAGFTVDTFDDL